MGILLIPAIFLVFKGISARYLISQLRVDGLGYLSDAWQNSPTLAALHRLDPEVIYTDNVGAVYFFLQEYPFSVPVKYDPVTSLERPDFEQSYLEMLNTLERNDAVLVLFSQGARLPEFALSEEVSRQLDLIGDYPDGRIFASVK
jgi:hypothetical protein